MAKIVEKKRESFTICTYKDLVEKLYHNNVDAIYMNNFEEIAKYLRDNLSENDLVITAGAGTVYEIADLLVNKK